LLAASWTQTFGCCCAMAQEQRRAVPCGGEMLARGTVSRVIDGRTFVLDDERKVRLAAIEVPPLSSPQEPGTAPGGTAARDALAALLAGAEIVHKLRRGRVRSLRARARLCVPCPRRD
jgi:endonuclease YncB( thermonuclease family)